MSSIDVPVHGNRFGSTARRDLWWLPPLLTFLGLGTFVIYSTWAAFQGNYYRFGPYLSPFYSPEILGDPSHAWAGAWPGWWPSWAASAALLILWAPGGFRLTCYYYRGAYYK
ncbi:MAG: succinate dehydrogenase, partial [Acidobacteriaceae bacterium]|nr:succinate dehydrogenase [Acidobacteriaceae bacterium]